MGGKHKQTIQRVLNKREANTLPNSDNHRGERGTTLPLRTRSNFSPAFSQKPSHHLCVCPIWTLETKLTRGSWKTFGATSTSKGTKRSSTPVDNIKTRLLVSVTTRVTSRSVQLEACLRQLHPMHNPTPLPRLRPQSTASAP